MGQILHSTGDGTWQPQTVGINQTFSLGGSGPNDVYAGGFDDTATGHAIAHSTGDGRWQLETMPSDAITVGSFAVPDAAHAWAGTRKGVIRRQPGGTWTYETSGVPAFEVSSVFAISATDIWAISDTKVMLHSTGDGTWTTQTVQPEQPADAQSGEYYLWASGPSDLYLIGFSLHTLMHSMGDGAWTPQLMGLTHNLRALGGSGPSDVYVGDQNGLVMRSTGDGRWTAEPTDLQPSSGGFVGLYAVGPGDVYGAIFGNSPFVILHRVPN
jgi:hypothetical protein